MDLGKRLKNSREAINMSREELAKALNISYWAIAKYETNERVPDLETFKKLAKIFNCTTDYLVGLTDSPEARIKPLMTETERKKKEIRKALLSVAAHADGDVPIEDGLVDIIYEHMERAKKFHTNKRKERND